MGPIKTPKVSNLDPEDLDFARFLIVKNSLCHDPATKLLNTKILGLC
jgi:hypothetical protein